MKTIKLATEYKCHPIWHVPNGPDDDFGPIEPDSLPISKTLLDKIKKWDETFQNTYVDSYPPDTGFKDSAKAMRFLNECNEIFDDLRKELNGRYTVIRKKI